MFHVKHVIVYTYSSQAKSHRENREKLVIFSAIMPFATETSSVISRCSAHNYQHRLASWVFHWPHIQADHRDSRGCHAVVANWERCPTSGPNTCPTEAMKP